MILEIPYDVKTYEIRGSIIWFDKEGILYSRPKPNPQVDVTNEEILDEMKRFRQIIGKEKVCMIAEAASGGTRGPKKEQRALIASEVASVTKALAVIVTSPVAKVAINLFYAFSPPPYPVKMFTTLEDAKGWIRKYNEGEEIPKKRTG